MKLTRFQDIPQFTRDGNWECDYPLDRLHAFIVESQEKFGLNLDPDFQRAHVWIEEQQIAWLEFFLRGGKTGRVIYLNQADWPSSHGEFVCVDGKQRIEAVRRFVANEIPAFGTLYKEFTDKLRVCQTMRVNVNSLTTRAEVIQWYIEMNAGGTPHTAAEIERVRKLLIEARK